MSQRHPALAPACRMVLNWADLRRGTLNQDMQHMQSASKCHIFGESGSCEAYFDTPLPLNLLGREASQEGLLTNSMSHLYMRPFDGMICFVQA